jgi:hypothetical protein
MRFRRFCCLVHSLFLLLLFLFAFYRPSNRGTILHADMLHFFDTLLDEALRFSPSGQNNRDDPGAPVHFKKTSPLASRLPSPAAAAPVSDTATAAQLLCQLLRGRTMLLVGPRETLYQLHSFLLMALHPRRPGPTASTARTSCPGPSSCPYHPLCHPLSLSRPSGSGPLTPADVILTNTSLMRFVHSTNLNPSPDPRLTALPSIDPRTGVRVIDSRWARYASSSKASILVLNRAPLSAPAWSYNASAGDWTWLSTLRHLEKQHAEPLSELFFSDLLSRLDHHHPIATRSGSRAQKLLLSAALHSTISTFLPSLLSTLRKLSEHAGHRAILGKKPVLWYGCWYLPISCAPESVSVFSSENDPRRLLARLLAEAEAKDNPWSAYYNAQGLFGNLGGWGDLPVHTKFVTSVYMHDRLLAGLLPTYGIVYISSLSTVIPPEVKQRDWQGDCLFYRPMLRFSISCIAKDWSCIQHVFETPRGAFMGQKFLGDLADTLSTWGWDDV